ncbi:uncharacterized protein TEOVI_000759500 [Trypanosoma equiperdum]|nr:hypothetical protein, conserved [Trypanosoma equiperdum]
MSSTLLATANQFYLLQQKKGRSFPHHGFTPRAIAAKRFAENTTTLSLSVGFFLPTMTQVHQQLEQLTVERDDIPMEKVVTTVVEAIKDNLVLFGDKLARLAVQTVIACGLAKKNKPYMNSVVYLWNVYPGLHDHYVGETLRYLRLPRFLSSLFGPHALKSDVDVFMQDISAAAAAEDSMKRAVLDMVADSVVDMVRVLLPPWLLRGPALSFKRRLKLFGHDILMRFTVAVTKVTGAGVGRAIAGHRGEYWGEIIGVATASFLFERISAMFLDYKRAGRIGSKSEVERGRSRSHSHGKDDVKGLTSKPQKTGERGRREGRR